MNELVKALADKFEIPINSEHQKIWFLRTRSGDFYYDFKINNYVALGWDKISPSLIKDNRKSNEAKKETIAQIYEDESRPGLILSQMNIFYTEMTKNDLIVIPSKGTKEIMIGCIGSIIDKVTKIDSEVNYIKCTHKHMRKVVWLKEIDLSHDIYLSKALRGQQTISNITNIKQLVYRNLFPMYLCDESIHFTLTKKNSKEFNLFKNIDLLSSISNLIDDISNLYQLPDIKKSLNEKTAVGSPGFIEIISNYLQCGAIIPFIVIKCILGKTKDSDGNTASGLCGVINQINTCINDHKNRKKIDAEIKNIEADTSIKKATERKIEEEIKNIEADSMYKKALAIKTLSEIDSSSSTNHLISIPPKNKIDNSLAELIKHSDELKKAILESDMDFIA